MLVVKWSNCLVSLLSLTRFMNPLCYCRFSSSIIIGLMFISVFHSVFLCIFVVWFLTISPPHPSFAKQLGCLPDFELFFFFFWEFAIPLVLYPLHEILSFLSFFQVYAYYSSFFLIRPLSIGHSMNIIVLCITGFHCSLLCHCYIRIVPQ